MMIVDKEMTPTLLLSDEASHTVRTMYLLYDSNLTLQNIDPSLFGKRRDNVKLEVLCYLFTALV